MSPAIERYLRGQVSAAVAVAELLLETRDLRQAFRALDDMMMRDFADGGARRRLEELRSLLGEHTDGCGTIVQMLDIIDAAGGSGVTDVESRLTRCASMFDALATQSEESAVALYSLGSADLLERATMEVIGRMRQLDLLAGDHAVLQIGCGTGRFEENLARSVALAHGIDISASMIDSSRRRCRHLTNVQFTVGSGRDLRPHRSATFDLVFAVDSMPYVVEVGDSVAASYFAEAARVLRRRGAFLIYNYSYRGDALADDRDVASLANDNGFEIVICGGQPFSLWNGREYLLRRRAT